MSTGRLVTPAHRYTLSPVYAVLTLSASTRIGVAVVALISLTGIGTLGYVLLEDMTWLDALYMTVITLSTVGFGEVHPLSSAGKLFSIVLITTSLGAVLYIVGALTEFFLEGRLGGVLWHRMMKTNLASIRDHVIVCGYGRLGQAVAHELSKNGIDIVVVDADASLEAQLIDAGLLYVIGSALEDEVLANAATERAHALVSTLPSDADGVFLTLSARQFNPEITIHARAETDTGAQRLRLAGADQVISPHLIGGQRIANALIRPAVVDFIELSAPGSGPEIDMEEVLIKQQSPANGGTVGTFAAPEIRVAVVAVQRKNEPMRLSPTPDMHLQAGDRVVVVGERDQLRRLAETMNKAAN